MCHTVPFIIQETDNDMEMFIISYYPDYITQKIILMLSTFPAFYQLPRTFI